MRKQRQLEIHDDAWIPSQCGRCFTNAQMRVRRVNDVAVQIEGNPGSWQGSKGGVCAKGASGLQTLYDPNRLNVPLRRTNPEKGLYADPKWEEITWDEAISEIVDRLKKVMADDPTKILWPSGVTFSDASGRGTGLLQALLDSRNPWLGGAGLHCGRGIHIVTGMIFSSWGVIPD